MVEVNFDTSVLVDYLVVVLDDQLCIDRLASPVSAPEQTRQLLENEQNRRVVGGKADEEFEALCNRHHRIYEDIIEWASRNQNCSLLEYDPAERDVHASTNDINFVRFRVLFEWSGEDRQKQLSDFRRLKQNVDAVHQRITELLDSTYPRFNDETRLSGELSDLNLNHDEAIVVDAVVIAEQTGVELLVSTDDDLTDNETQINDRIQAAGRSVTLEINEPNDL